MSLSLCKSCTSWVGSRTALSLLSIAGRRDVRTLCRHCGRVRPAQGRCHRHGGRGGPRSKAGDIGHPDHLCSGDDPVGAGLVASLARPGGNVTGLSVKSADLVGKGSIFCASCPRPSPVSNHGQCWLSRRPTGHARGSSGGPHTRLRCHPARNQAGRGYRAAFDGLRVARTRFMFCADSLTELPTEFGSIAWR